MEGHDRDDPHMADFPDTVSSPCRLFGNCGEIWTAGRIRGVAALAGMVFALNAVLYCRSPDQQC